MNIRHAVSDELYTIAVFLDDCWREAYNHILSPDYLENMSAEKRHELFIKQYEAGSANFLVMYEENQLIGAAVYGRSTTEGFENDGEISAIYLRKDQIGKGHGHTLFAEAERLLTDMGYKNFVLDVFSANERAIGFYLKHGYKKVDDRTIRLGEREYPMMVLRKNAEESDTKAAR